VRYCLTEQHVLTWQLFAADLPSVRRRGAAAGENDGCTVPGASAAGSLSVASQRARQVRASRAVRESFQDLVPIEVFASPTKSSNKEAWVCIGGSGLPSPKTRRWSANRRSRPLWTNYAPSATANRTINTERLNVPFEYQKRGWVKKDIHRRAFRRLQLRPSSHASGENNLRLCSHPKMSLGLPPA
jgi:hypothetical protein